TGALFSVINAERASYSGVIAINIIIPGELKATVLGIPASAGSEITDSAEASLEYLYDDVRSFAGNLGMHFDSAPEDVASEVIVILLSRPELLHRLRSFDAAKRLTFVRGLARKVILENENRQISAEAEIPSGTAKQAGSKKPDLADLDAFIEETLDVEAQ